MLLEGRNVRLMLTDRENLEFFIDFRNAIDFYGEHEVTQPQRVLVVSLRKCRQEGFSNETYLFQFQPNDDISFEFQLSGHEGPFGSKFAIDHVQVVSVCHRDRN